MKKAKTILVIFSVLFFAFFENSCLNKPKGVECNNIACDTIDTYYIIFNKNDSTQSLIGYDTIKINSEATSCKLVGWHCRSCQGEEEIGIFDSAGNKIDSLMAKHDGSNVESSQWNLFTMERGKVFKVNWLLGRNFYIIRN